LKKDIDSSVKILYIFFTESKQANNSQLANGRKAINYELEPSSPQPLEKKI